MSLYLKLVRQCINDSSFRGILLNYSLTFTTRQNQYFSMHQRCQARYCQNFCSVHLISFGVGLPQQFESLNNAVWLWY